MMNTISNSPLECNNCHRQLSVDLAFELNEYPKIYFCVFCLPDCCDGIEDLTPTSRKLAEKFDLKPIYWE